jgi:hypothetical protein
MLICIPNRPLLEFRLVQVNWMLPSFHLLSSLVQQTIPRLRQIKDIRELAQWTSVQRASSAQVAKANVRFVP